MKTLKDLSVLAGGYYEPDANSFDERIVFEKELRAEAIRWLKTMKRKDEVQQLLWDTPASSPERIRAVEEDDELDKLCEFTWTIDGEGIIKTDAVMWIMHFFNITDEELK